MPRPSVVHPQVRPSQGDRVVTDDAGLLWSATLVQDQGEAFVMFTCITDARRSGRISCLAADPGIAFADLPDETLRDWLRQAPPIGRLH
ncbi:MAG: hypothetical protein HY275_17995 [Gemmatimonadetes bacterium]|nr:hypothetical protein [Gemmatimonadota bacterium]